MVERDLRDCKLARRDEVNRLSRSEIVRRQTHTLFLPLLRNQAEEVARCAPLYLLQGDGMIDSLPDIAAQRLSVAA